MKTKETLHLYVEGGGNSEDLHGQCREGFCKFIEKAGNVGKMPRIVACGDRGKTYDRFKTACSQGKACLLLVDSEDRVTASSPWEHLKTRKGDGWDKPANATDDQCHLMVVCMESWFLADKATLSDFFGQGFIDKALPQRQNIEEISKDDVYQGLEKASAHCKTKAPYGKGAHSFKILARIEPDKIKTASTWAARFFDKLAR